MEGIGSTQAATRLRRAGAISSIFAALALTAILFARRVTGDVSSPLAIELLVPTATLLAAWAWLVQLAFKDCGVVRVGTFPVRAETLSLWLPMIVVLCFAVALSFPGARTIDWFAWLAALAAIALGPSRVLSGAKYSNLVGRKKTDEIALQDLKRYRAADGRECVRGVLATEFIPAQRTATLYAAFCPPFEYLPEVKAKALCKDASVKVAQVLHNGVQLEVRLARESKCKQVVTVEFFATEHKSESQSATPAS